MTSSARAQRKACNKKPRRSGARFATPKWLVLRALAAGGAARSARGRRARCRAASRRHRPAARRTGAARRAAAARSTGAARLRLACMLGRGRVLFARELAVVVLVELVEILVVRRALRSEEHTSELQ